jgi:hypothetical protein
LLEELAPALAARINLVVVGGVQGFLAADQLIVTATTYYHYRLFALW